VTANVVEIKITKQSKTSVEAIDNKEMLT